MRVLSSAALAATLLFTAARADAALVIYSTLADFQAATNGVTTVDFEGITAANSFASYNNGPLVTGGVTFTSDGSMFVIGQDYYGSPYTSGAYLNSDFAGANNKITATLGSGVSALAMDFGGLFAGGTVSFLFEFSDGSSFTASTTQSVGGGSLAFIGFGSTQAITSVTMTMPDGPFYNAIDNFRYGDANNLPEPASLALAGLALAGMAAVRRRR